MKRLQVVNKDTLKLEETKIHSFFKLEPSKLYELESINGLKVKFNYSLNLEQWVQEEVAQELFLARDLFGSQLVN